MVVSSVSASNFHSIGRGGSSHSTTMRWCGSTAITRTWAETPYHSHSQSSSLPSSSRPLLLEYQNLLVIDGSTIAANTSATGLRIIIAVRATGGFSSVMSRLRLVA